MTKPMSPSPTGVPPRRKGGSGGRNVPPPRRPANQRPRRRRPRWLVLGVPGLAIVVAVILIVVLTRGGGSTKHNAAVNYSVGGQPAYGKLGPEGIPLQLGSPLAAANTGLSGQPIDGIVSSSQEQVAYHHHVHLVIFVNGQIKALPLAIGMVPPAQVQQSAKGDFAGSATALYWLHVHAQDGIVHIESPEPKTFELGQFFDIWGQPLSTTQVGPAKGSVTATLNGKPWAGDPRSIPLDEHAQIVLNVGGPVVVPPSVSWSGSQL